MRLLYIAPNTGERITGGVLGRDINHQILSEYSGDLHSYLIDIKQPRIIKAIAVLCGYKNGLRPFHIRKILTLIRSEKIDAVFFDGSLYGALAKKIKAAFPGIKILSFFHNCERKLYDDCYKEKPAFVRRFIVSGVAKNEKNTLLYSTVNIFINSHDAKLCQEYYNVDTSGGVCSPLALHDTFPAEMENQSAEPLRPFNLLFVGSYFLPNINGLLWFDKNVLPYIGYQLTIVGKGFEESGFTGRLRAKNKISAKGFVENLDEEYNRADIVIQPVFDGAGMKTKTAECFMYGKTLVSTSEGLSGYAVAGQRNIYRCDTAAEFIDVLTKLQEQKAPRYNPEIRKLFLDNYSKKSREKVFFDLLERI